ARAAGGVAAEGSSRGESSSKEIGDSPDPEESAFKRRFKITPESYRLKFRNYRRPDNVTYTETAHKLFGYLKRWIMGEGAQGSYDKLLDLIAKEQLLEIAPHYIKAAVLDREPSTILEAARIADTFIQNRSQDKQRASPTQGRLEGTMGPGIRLAPTRLGNLMPTQNQKLLALGKGLLPATCVDSKVIYDPIVLIREIRMP
uniref:SCAN box domain-containing protein n=1 Tax=Pelusios castaneus TaxID=367368 RepID=A0A8C8RFZ3_9SAUR